MSDSVVILGDETSIGLAYAMFHESQGKVQAFLEVDDVESTRRVVEHLQFHGVQLVSRGEDDVHLAEIETQLDAFAAEGASFVLTGNAASIQRLRRKLKSAGVAAARLLTKAYWAQGKKGLD